jgi:glycosyltransferase involved in cell wall biosynthesis
MKIALDARMLSLDVFSSRGMGRYINQLFSSLVSIDTRNQYFLLSNNDNKSGQYKGHTISFGKAIPFSKQGVIHQNIIQPIKLSYQNINLMHYTLLDLAPVWHTSGITSVITVPDLIPVRTKHFGKGVKQQIYEQTLKRALRSCHSIIAISSHVKEDIIDFLGQTDHDITVTPLAVNRDTFYAIERKIAANIVRENLGISTPFILYTGGFDTRKQISRLITAFNDLILSTKLPHSLVLVGRVEAYPSFVSIIREIARLKLQSRVIITDYVSDDDLLNLYNAADVFAFPSAAEGFGLPLLEAMACGAPVVAFNNSSIPEVVQSGGILVSNADWSDFTEALRKVLVGEFNQDVLRKNAIEQACKFTWTHTAQQTLSVYQEAFTKKMSERKYAC